jgi:hypothetical protein
MPPIKFSVDTAVKRRHWRISYCVLARLTINTQATGFGNLTNIRAASSKQIPVHQPKKDSCAAKLAETWLNQYGCNQRLRLLSMLPSGNRSGKGTGGLFKRSIDALQIPTFQYRFNLIELIFGIHVSFLLHSSSQLNSGIMLNLYIQLSVLFIRN